MVLVSDSIVGIRDMHQFDGDTNGSLLCCRTSQSNNVTIHVFTPRSVVQSQPAQDFSDME